MELIFSRKDMDRAMKMVSRAAGKSSALPILSTVLISATQDPLWSASESSQNHRDIIYLAATDLETGIRMRIPGQIMESGAIALPVKTFASVISALSEDEVRLATSDGKARIRCHNGEFKIAGASADEFPSLMGEVSQDAQLELTNGSPGDEKETHFLSLDSDALGWMIRKTSFASSRDDARYFLNGVHLTLKSEAGGELVRMAATDGTRLAVASVVIEEVLEKEVEAIIPNRAVRELEKLTASSDIMKMSLQENRMVFDAGDTALVSTLLEGQYPDYQRVIPDVSRINLKADTGHLLAVVRRISQVSDPRMPWVRLEMAGNRMKVSASSVGMGEGRRGHRDGHQCPLPDGCAPRHRCTGDTHRYGWRCQASGHKAALRRPPVRLDARAGPAIHRWREGDGTMTTIYDTDEDGNIIVVFDSRWKFPELLGFSPDDPEYEALQRMWEEQTGKQVPEEVVRTRRLTRDKVISVVKGKKLVGVYWEGTDGSEFLFECSPEKADRIIEIFNEEEDEDDGEAGRQ